MNYAVVKIIKGELLDYLKDIEILGIKEENGELTILGCKNEHQDQFYKGILEYDKVTGIQGFKTAEEVKHWWEECADMMFLCVEKDNYEELEILEILGKREV